MDRELLVGLPERLLELVRAEHEAALPRPDVEEQRLDQLGVHAKQQLLQPLVGLAAVEPSGDDTCDERPAGRPGEDEEHLTADQGEQRLERVLVVEQARARTLSAADKAAHTRAPSW